MRGAALAGDAVPRQQIWHLRLQSNFAKMIKDGTKDVEARLNMGEAARIKEEQDTHAKSTDSFF